MGKSVKIKPWLVLAGTFVMLFTCIGLGASGLTLFYQPVANELGFSQTSFSLYYSLSTLVGMFFMPVVGLILSKKPEIIRVLMLICGFFLMISFIGYSISVKIWHFYTFSILRGVITCGISAVPATMMLNNWFESKRGLITAIAFTGSSFGGVFYTQISNYFINNFGWHVAYRALGIIAFATVIIALLLVSPSPESCGSVAYIDVKERREDNKKNAFGISSKGAFKTFSFWMMLIAIFLGGIVVMGVQQGMAPSLILDYSFSGDKAASLYSVFMIILCVGKIVYGWIVDRFGQKLSIIYVGIMNVLAMLAFLNVDKGDMFANFLVLCFGLGNVTATVMMTSITTFVFGTKNYGTIYGTINMLASAGMSVGPIVTAGLFDAGGSYRPAWSLYLVISIVVMFMLLTVLAGKKQVTRIAVKEEGNE